jgi:hypothetical protein
VFRGELVGGNSQRRTVCLKRIKFVAQEGKDGKERREKVINSPSLRGGPNTQLTT